MSRLRSRPVVQLVITLALALALAYTLQRFVVGVFRVPSSST